MIFSGTTLNGVFILELEKREDDRGFFARSFCRDEYREHGLNPCIAQCNISYNRRKGTIRGLHYQAAPAEEDKLVRCTRGAIYDVIVDIRPGSPTYCRWESVSLGEDDRRMVYIPKGFAHGFQTLADDTEVFYQMSEFYMPERSKGIRWDDPAFAIRWPLENQVISEKDKSYGGFEA
jgi:dTDP-4-dehydrorhamnose 3,5-epimerase